MSRTLAIVGGVLVLCAVLILVLKSRDSPPDARQSDQRGGDANRMDGGQEDSIPVVGGTAKQIAEQIAAELTSDFKNIDLKVQYVGTAKCASCHAEQHTSYLLTAHSDSLGLTNIAAEAEGSKFVHDKSGRAFEVAHVDGQLVHRESLIGAGEPVLLHEVPVSHVVGSGTFGKSYLYKKGGYFLQSPITWFENQERWHMSPGYDSERHRSFARQITSDCFFCHAGILEEVAGNPYDVRIDEFDIGCERCHGPGELHTAKFAGTSDVTLSGDPDYTIVNPTRLERGLSEAICQQCHLQGSTQVFASDRRQWDFRPSLPLEKFRIDFHQQLGSDQMRIVGHVEQMHSSECYTKSNLMTCVTCHDPHGKPAADKKVEYYRAACLKCHADQGCSLAEAVRHEKAEDSCVQCHMPPAPTEVPHVAFTHHRIGIHSADSSEKPAVSGLTTIQNRENVTKLEFARAEALAYFTTFMAEGDRPEFKEYHLKAWDDLNALKKGGMRDHMVEAALARLALMRGDRAASENFAREAVLLTDSPTPARLDALDMLSRSLFDQEKYDEALVHYRELTRYSRNAYHWAYLGYCESNVDHLEEALAALKMSLEIEPAQSGAQASIALILYALKRPEEAEEYAKAAKRMAELLGE
jgi:tetratricopeptide (TPR) repeat protein